MLRITVELWPNGDVQHAREIGHMDIGNIGSMDCDIGTSNCNYHYCIQEKGSAFSRTVMRDGIFTNYDRNNPAWSIISAILAKEFSNGDEE